MVMDGSDGHGHGILYQMLMQFQDCLKVQKNLENFPECKS